MRKPLQQGDRTFFPIFSTLFEKLLPARAAAFFPGFISVQHLALSRAPMNGSLTRNWCGRVSLISSISKSLSREGD